MKKLMMLLVSGLAVIALSGCGGGGGAYDAGYDDGFYDGARASDASMTTLFLIDQDGFSLGGVPYYCVDPSGVRTADYVTAPNGEFTFVPGERCTFDLYGYNGTPEDPLFIVDDVGIGKPDIPYACDGGDNGLTDVAGSFDYLPDDICTLYL